MRLFIKNTIALLSISAAVCSCSMAFLDGKAGAYVDGSRILITGTVSELESAQPLKDIRITFKAYAASESGAVPLIAEETWSKEDGVYAIAAPGHQMPLRCTIIAEDMSSAYEGQMHEISVTWSGPSYDKKHNSFIVNDCNFQLQKIRGK